MRFIVEIEQRVVGKLRHVVELHVRNRTGDLAGILVAYGEEKLFVVLDTGKRCFQFQRTSVLGFEHLGI